MPLAKVVAEPVVSWSLDGPVSGAVCGRGRGVAYFEFGGFVVAVLEDGLPLMPNGIGVDRLPYGDRWAVVGAQATLSPGVLVAGQPGVGWSVEQPPTWQPRLHVTGDQHALHARGADMLWACGIAPDADPMVLAARFAARGVCTGAVGAVALLLRSMVERSPLDAGRAAQALIGRGDGLTPEGDDFVTAAVAVVSSLALEVGWSEAERALWLDAVVSDEVRLRTTALSATLLELAEAGDVIQPLHHVLDLNAQRRRWRASFERLRSVGHSTGAAYAGGCGAAAFLCTIDPARAMVTTPTAKGLHARR